MRPCATLLRRRLEPAQTLNACLPSRFPYHGLHCGHWLARKGNDAKVSVMLAILGAIARGPTLGKTLDIDSCVDEGTSVPCPKRIGTQVLVDEAQQEGRKTIPLTGPAGPARLRPGSSFLRIRVRASMTLGPVRVPRRRLRHAQMLLASGALGKDASSGACRGATGVFGGRMEIPSRGRDAVSVLGPVQA